MKTLELNQMEAVQAAGGCEAAETAAQIAFLTGNTALGIGIVIGSTLAGC